MAIDIELARSLDGGETWRSNNNNLHATSSSLHISSLSTEEQQQPPAARSRNTLEPAPASNSFRVPHNLPVKMADVQKKKPPPPKLLHPVLHKIPMHVRFGFNGFISNVLFMMAYQYAVAKFQDVNASTIYSVVYLIFIPVTHAILSLLVFGWPDRYVPSLMSNFPIGITAIGLGASLTAYLDRIDFDEQTVEFLQQHWSTWVASSSSASSSGKSRILSKSLRLGDKNAGGSDNDPVGEFYSSLLVLFVTGIWTFVLSVFVNAPTAPTDKKEL